MRSQGRSAGRGESVVKMDLLSCDISHFQVSVRYELENSANKKEGDFLL